MRPTRLYASGAVFFVGMAAVVYGIMKPNIVTSGNTAFGIAGLIGVGVLHFGAGFAARSWWVVLWPLVAVLISVPAGVPNDPNSYEELPIWFGMLVIIEPAGLVLITAGMLAAKLMDRYQRRRPPRPRMRLLHHRP